MKFFNTAGPIKSEMHYHLSPVDRLDLKEVLRFIEEQKYFVLYAPRQTGKTSMMLALMDLLNEGGRYRALYVNVESGQGFGEDVAKAMGSIYTQLAHNMKVYLKDALLQNERAQLKHDHEPHDLLFAALSRWTEVSDKPTILFIDEIDALVGDTLVTVLRQLRTGYTMRPQSFPHSIILCGVRDVRDYRIHASSEKAPITGGSAFNVKAASLRMGNFSENDVRTLLGQHKEATGQVFTDDACALIYHKTQGQPWLVNAIAYQITTSNESYRNNPSKTIDVEVVEDAIETIILRRETHLDQLADKLREPRIHRVVAPILAGSDQATNLHDDDIDYAYDLGLIEKKPGLRIANPIYAEVIPRMLTYPIQVSLSQETHWFIDGETGRIDMAKLLRAFQDFYRQNSDHWVNHYHYKEAGAQLLLQAFLQRVINGGGRIDREYGLGKGRTDLLVSLKTPSGEQRIVLELKVQRGTRKNTIEKALPQITRYMDTCGSDEGHLIIFNHNSEQSWQDKIFEDKTSFEGMTIQIWGM